MFITCNKEKERVNAFTSHDIHVSMKSHQDNTAEMKRKKTKIWQMGKIPIAIGHIFFLSATISLRGMWSQSSSKVALLE